MPISGNFQAFNSVVQPWVGNNTAPPAPSTRHDSVADAPIVPGAPANTGVSTGGGAPFAAAFVSIFRAMGIGRDVSRTTDSPNQAYRGGAFSGTEQFGSEHDMSAHSGYRPGSQSSPVARGGTTEWRPLGGTQVPGGFNGRRPAWFPVNHAGTNATRGAYAAQFHDGLSNYANSRNWQGRSDAARAHSDGATARVTGANYHNQPVQFSGEYQTQDREETKGYSSAFTGRMLAKNHNDGFMDGDPSVEYQTTYHTGGTHARNWFTADYSSPTIGAMYSRNPLRGVLPNFISTPFPQPPLTGGYKTAGIAPNQRQLLKRFTTPTLFRSPPSEAATISVVNDGSAPSNTLGMGF